MPYGHMAKSKCQSDEDITKKKKKFNWKELDSTEVQISSKAKRVFEKHLARL
jgi:hypothetical protein